MLKIGSGFCDRKQTVLTYQIQYSRHIETIKISIWGYFNNKWVLHVRGHFNQNLPINSKWVWKLRVTDQGSHHKISIPELMRLSKMIYEDIYLTVWPETYSLTPKAPKHRNGSKIQINYLITELLVLTSREWPRVAIKNL